MIYVIGTDAVRLVKIGFSKNADVQVRFAGIQAHSPVPLKLLATAPGTRNDEWKLHAAFFAHRSHSEWFHLVPEIEAFIQHVNQHGEIPAPLRGEPCQPNPLNGPHLAAKRKRAERENFWGSAP